MVTPPVTRARIEIAARHIANAGIGAVACRDAELPFFVACALLEQESGGKNIYGHDDGGVNTLPDGREMAVDQTNFLAFLVKVMGQGRTSNGVGPGQITYAGQLKCGLRDGGYFAQMLARGLKPWRPHDNMLFAFETLAAHKVEGHSWGDAYAHYNGGTSPNATARARGERFGRLVETWKTRLNIG